MELGEKLKLARLEAGFSQRQLCGEVITRNMLSQIENGTARPSMDTLRYLAGRLGKSLSYFLEDDAVVSPNLQVMIRARELWTEGRRGEVLEILKDYREPDRLFDMERQLLYREGVLEVAREALEAGKPIYAGELLTQLGALREGYCAEDLERRRLLLLAAACPRELEAVCGGLPALDEELMIRAAAAMERQDYHRGGALLDAAEDRENPKWNLLRGKCHEAEKAYRSAIACYLKAEPALPEETAPGLERCYRELEDYKMAYHYAYRQRK